MFPRTSLLLPTPGAHNQQGIRRLARLPYDIQEDITSHLPHSDLHSLSLASKYLSVLAARAMYTTIHLHSIDEDSHSHAAKTRRKLNLRPLDALRLRQFSFFVAIAHHPEYTRFIRHISFEFTDNHGPQRTPDYLVPEDLVWRVFSKCEAVSSIHITVAMDGERRVGPVKGIFPNLVEATVEGAFPECALDKILHTSARLRRLKIKTGTAEMVAIPGLRGRSELVQESLANFIARSVARGAFGGLQSLEVSCEQSDGGALLKLLEEVKESLEELGVTVVGGEEDDWWVEWGQGMKKVEWKKLKRVRVGGVSVTGKMVEEMSGLLEASSK